MEIGNGFEAVEIGGVDNADEITAEKRSSSPIMLAGFWAAFQGQDIVCRVAFKPTSSILTPRATIDKKGNETEIITKGRHDPCVGIRGVPVVRGDDGLRAGRHWLRHKAQNL